MEDIVLGARGLERRLGLERFLNQPHQEDAILERLQAFATFKNYCISLQ